MDKIDILKIYNLAFNKIKYDLDEYNTYELIILGYLNYSRKKRIRILKKANRKDDKGFASYFIAREYKKAKKTYLPYLKKSAKCGYSDAILQETSKL